MGFSPTGGFMMATRSGHLDPTRVCRASFVLEPEETRCSLVMLERLVTRPLWLLCVSAIRFLDLETRLLENRNLVFGRSDNDSHRDQAGSYDSGSLWYCLMIPRARNADQRVSRCHDRAIVAELTASWFRVTGSAASCK